MNQSNRRIARNTTLLYFRMIFVLFVSLYTSRVVLRTLGVSDFGVYNVVSGFVSMFGFLSATLSASMQRFYNYYLGKSGDSGVSTVYTTGLTIHVIIAIILFIILETAGLYYINNVMVVPSDRLFASNIVYQAVVFSMVLVILQIPYSGAVLAYEKMDYYALISIVDVILKLAIVLILPLIPYDKLITYGGLLCMISIVNISAYFIYAKTRLNGIQRSKKDQKLTKEIMSFSGWNLVGTFAFMIKDQGLNMLLNVFFGTVVNAARGLSFQIKSAIANFSQSIATAFRPQIVDAYAKDDNSRVLSLFYFESKICYSLILLLIIPVIFEIDTILSLWIGEDVPEQTSIFTILVLIDSLVCAINPSINHVIHATGKINSYQKANTMVNILIIPVSWVSLYLGANAISVFWVTIIFSVLNQFVCIYKLNKVFCIESKRFFLSVIIPCLAVTILSIAPHTIIVYCMEESIYRLFVVCAVDIFITTTAFAFIILKRSERQSILNIITQKKSKK